jgi:hypothetical protein
MRSRESPILIAWVMGNSSTDGADTATEQDSGHGSPHSSSGALLLEHAFKQQYSVEFSLLLSIL